MAVSLKPTAKQGANGVAGAAALVLIFLAGLFGLVIPAEVAASAVFLISWCAGYLKRETAVPDYEPKHRATTLV